ncbi:hypothetical protein GGR53DRAFT_470638 [Hypoxylon sp. FL1150]|nr:hypothetical protein GGR53DRAFT_470638 [Hypoxylon sp. FL1150]
MAMAYEWLADCVADCVEDCVEDIIGSHSRAFADIVASLSNKSKLCGNGLFFPFLIAAIKSEQLHQEAMHQLRGALAAAAAAGLPWIGEDHIWVRGQHTLCLTNRRLDRARGPVPRNEDTEMETPHCACQKLHVESKERR